MNKKFKFLKYFIILAFVTLLNSGCMGLVGKNMMLETGGTYSEFSTSQPPIPEGKGRVFIYMVDGGSSFANTMGVLGEPLSIDDIVHFIAGETFFYVDLDIGKHTVTASKMFKGVIKKTIVRGENAVDLVLSNQDVKYIRIDIKGTIAIRNAATYYPILLDSNKNAAIEINSLKLYTAHNHGIFGDKVWKLGDTFM